MNEPAPDANLSSASSDACPIPRLRNVEQLTPTLQARVDKGSDELWFRQFGHAPDHFERWLDMYTPLLFKGRIEMRTKELARLRIAQLNACHY